MKALDFAKDACDGLGTLLVTGVVVSGRERAHLDRKIARPTRLVPTSTPSTRQRTIVIVSDPAAADRDQHGLPRGWLQRPQPAGHKLRDLFTRGRSVLGDVAGTPSPNGY